MGESQIGKAPRPQTPDAFCFCCAFSLESVMVWMCVWGSSSFLWNLVWCEWVWGDPPSFSGICNGVNGCGEVPIAFNGMCLSHGNIPFYWDFLPVDYYEDYFFLSYTV